MKPPKQTVQQIRVSWAVYQRQSELEMVPARVKQLCALSLRRDGAHVRTFVNGCPAQAWLNYHYTMFKYKLRISLRYME